MNKETKVDRKAKTLGLVQVALFAALIIIMAFTPFLGYIPLGFTRATIIHIPVIMGSILLGPRKGAILGGVFGLTSFINNNKNLKNSLKSDAYSKTVSSDLFVVKSGIVATSISNGETIFITPLYCFAFIFAFTFVPVILSPYLEYKSITISCFPFIYEFKFTVVS